jgi:hypothetical protein
MEVFHPPNAELLTWSASNNKISAEQIGGSQIHNISAHESSTMNGILLKFSDIESVNLESGRQESSRPATTSTTKIETDRFAHRAPAFAE